MTVMGRTQSRPGPSDVAENDAKINLSQHPSKAPRPRPSSPFRSADHTPQIEARPALGYACH
jgi:hypothetical protein